MKFDLQKFVDFKSFTKQQWTMLGCAVLFLGLFMWSEYERRRPFEEASRGLDEILAKDREIECRFLRQRGDWQTYNQKCK